MAICNSVQVDVDQTTGDVLYKAASPDEEALCYGARQNGFTFLGRERSTLSAVVLGDQRKYELLSEMEFSSDRRRMSVILRVEDGSIIMLSKGADSVMAERLAPTTENGSLMDLTNSHLEKFSEQGLRTLLVGYKKLSEEVWNRWRESWVVAANLIEGREEAVRVGVAFMCSYLILRIRWRRCMIRSKETSYC